MVSECCSEPIHHSPPLVQEVEVNDAGVLDVGQPELMLHLLAAHHNSKRSGSHHLSRKR